MTTTTTYQDRQERLHTIIDDMARAGSPWAKDLAQRDASTGTAKRCLYDVLNCQDGDARAYEPWRHLVALLGHERARAVLDAARAEIEVSR